MKQLFPMMILIGLAFSCSDDPQLKNYQLKIDVKEQLNLFIANEVKQRKSAGEKITPKIIEYMETKYGYKMVEKNTTLYQRKLAEYISNSNGTLNSARTKDCDSEVTLIADNPTTPDCWVFVIEFGAGCSNSGCVGNE